MAFTKEQRIKGMTALIASNKKRGRKTAGLEAALAKLKASK